jgi:hypothetical protein
MRTLISSLACMVMLSLMSAKAEEPPGPRAMRGLTSVFVLIEGLDAVAGKLVLDVTQLQTDVELKLRLAGMRVIPNGGLGVAFVYVNVNIADDASAANVSLSLSQDVTLYRDPALFIAATPTWATETLLTHPTGLGIRNKVKDQVDRFLNEWLKANPRSQLRLHGEQAVTAMMFSGR